MKPEKENEEAEDSEDHDVHHDESRRNGFDEEVAEEIGAEEDG